MCSISWYLLHRVNVNERRLFLIYATTSTNSVVHSSESARQNYNAEWMMWREKENHVKHFSLFATLCKCKWTATGLIIGDNQYSSTCILVRKCKQNYNGKWSTRREKENHVQHFSVLNVANSMLQQLKKQLISL